MKGYQRPIIDRYLLRELIGPFLFSIGAFVIIGLVDLIFALVDLFVNSGVSLGVVSRLLLYKIPAIMVMFLPMSAIFTTMLLLVRMAKDNELVILRTSGMPIFRMIIPIAIFGLCVSITSLGINEFVTPWANHVSEQLIRTTIQRKPPPTVVDNIFFKEAGNRFLFIRSVNIKTGEMRDLLMFEKTRLPFPRLITAKRATWDEEFWHLMDGTVYELNPSGNIKYISSFQDTTIHIVRDLHSFYTKRKTPKEMDSSELKEKIDAYEKGGINTNALRIEYHLKKSLPFACFIFSLMGMTCCIVMVRSGKDWWGVIWAIVIVVLLVGLYFVLMAIFRAIGNKGLMSPILSTWIPNVLYVIPCASMLIYDGTKR